MLHSWCNKCAKFISNCTCPEMDLIAAVKRNNLERVRLLVEEEGADKDNVDLNGKTPLWWAAWDGYLEVTQYLVEQGATLDKANNDGWTPLLAAAVIGHLEVVRFLLEQGADRDKANNDGWSPLHYSALQGHLETVVLLMSYGADLNARTKGGQLPAVAANTEEIRQAILDEPRRRMDHGHKRATEQDRHPNASISASAQQEEEEVEGEEDEQGNKRPRLDEGGNVEVTMVASEDEDSEPSDDEEDD